MKMFIALLAITALAGAHPQKRQASDLSMGLYGGQDPNAVMQQIIQKLPFLQGVNREGQGEFFSLITDMNTPRGQIETSLNNWAKKYNVESQWTTFKTQYEAQKTELVAALRDFVGKLPAAFDQIIKNGEDKSLSGNEALDKDSSIFSSLTQNVGSAIQKFANFLFGDKDATSPPPGGNPFGGNNNNNNNNGGFTGNGAFPGGNNNNGGNNHNNGGFPGNNGGFPGNNNNNGGFPGNNGGFPGNNNNGGFPGNQNGGFPGNNNGGFPGNNNNNNNGGFPGNQNGGFPGNNNGNNGGFPGNNGQFGGNGGFPGSFGGNNNNNNQFGGFQIPGQQGNNQNNNNGRPAGGSGQFTQNGFSRF